MLIIPRIHTNLSIKALNGGRHVEMSEQSESRTAPSSVCRTSLHNAITVIAYQKLQKIAVFFKTKNYYNRFKKR